jgi:membrane protease YdiL (CAAX protease family)
MTPSWLWPRLLVGPPAYRARTGWPAGAAVSAAVMIVAAGAIGALLILVAAGVVLGLLFPGADQAANGGVLALRIAQPGSISAEEVRQTVLYLLLSQAILILGTVSASSMFRSVPAEVLALHAPAGGKRVYVEAFLGMICILGLFSTFAVHADPQGVTGDLKPFVGLIQSDSWWITLLAVGLGAPLSEELLFRGFLFSGLAKSRVGVLGAGLLTTAAWTALHGSYSITGVIEVGLIGLYFSWVLWRTGSLRVTIVCHAVYNTMLITTLALVPLSA